MTSAPTSLSDTGWHLAVLQFNPVVGDLGGNAGRIVALARQVREQVQGPVLVVTPELALCGYPPEDLLLRPAFIDACESQLRYIAQALSDAPGLHLLVGHPARLPGAGLRDRSRAAPGLLNAVSHLHGGRILATGAKRELPNYQVFDERRYFVSGRDAGQPGLRLMLDGLRVGVLICEDAWFEEPGEHLRQQGIDLAVVLNASPFHAGKHAEREASMSRRAIDIGCPLVYAHLVGGQDEVVFDGASFAVDAGGRLVSRAASFREDLLMLRVGPEGLSGPAPRPLPCVEEELWNALVLGVRDYVGKNGFPGALIGLSGGIDSALVLAIAVDALGADRVRTVMMPSPYTADISWIDARDMADRLKVRHDEIAIAPMFDEFNAALAPLFAGREADTTEENIQARIRGTLLMALSNKTGAIVLTTGNKSEMATGYCTLYGDMAGGFAVIKDVVKTMVYRLSRWRNEQALQQGQVEPIPERIIVRPPSAELRPDQVDQDSLPPYEVLDDILQRYMEQDQSPAEVLAAGHAQADVDKVTRLIRLNEYKRRQAPVGIRVTHRAFGRDWRYPITSKWRA